MIPDIIANISKYFKFCAKIRMKKCNKILNQRVKIYEIPLKIMKRLTDDKLKKYPDLVELFLHYDSKITDEGIKNLSNLKELCIC